MAGNRAGDMGRVLYGVAMKLQTLIFSVSVSLSYMVRIVNGGAKSRNTGVGVPTGKG